MFFFKRFKNGIAEVYEVRVLRERRPIPPRPIWRGRPRLF